MGKTLMESGSNLEREVSRGSARLAGPEKGNGGIHKSVLTYTLMW